MADILKMTPLENWIREKISAPSAERLKLEDLKSYQEKAFWKNFLYAKNNSTFYRKFYAGVEAGSGFAGMEAVPLLREEHLRQFGKQMLCVQQDAIHRIVTLASSGTTGEPKRVYFTEKDQELTVDFFANGMQTFTESGDKVLILLPSATPGCVGDLLSIGLRRFGAKPLPYGILDDCEKVLALLYAEQPQVIVANPVQMLLLAYYYEKNRCRFPEKSIALQAILLSTDYIAESLVSQLQRIFACPVYEHYGMTEMGLGGAVACTAQKGYHMREADMLFEVVNPETGKQVPVGEYGEVVFTTLTREAMPFIRYATGDWGRFLPHSCACSTVLPRLDKIAGRLDDAVGITQLDEILFAYDGILNYTANLNAEVLELILHCLDESVSLNLPQIAAALPYQAKIQVEYGIKPLMYQLAKRQIKSKECSQ